MKIIVENQEIKKVLQLALDAGITQLSNGAEVWRVEETLSHICSAYGIEDVDAFVLSNAIFITGNNEGEDVYAKVKHVPLSGVHLGIVTAVNNLSREISSGSLTVDEARERLGAIQKIPAKNTFYRAGASAVGAACFIYILGANVPESIIAGCIGGFVFLFSNLMDRQKLSKLVKNIFEGAFVGLLAYLVTRIPGFSGFDIGKIIIGGIMPLIPGAAFINSIRDIANTDFLSGTVRMLDTIMVFVYLAVGAGAMLSTCSGLFGGV